MASPPHPNLELRPLGNTGLKLSCVGFGASPLGSVFGPVSEHDAISSVREAFDLGINFFDTSPYVSVFFSSTNILLILTATLCLPVFHYVLVLDND
jgi:L-galactose dehydrogenase